MVGGAKFPPQTDQQSNFLIGRECTGHLHPIQHRAWDWLDPTGFPIEGMGIKKPSAVHDHLRPILDGPIGQFPVGQQKDACIPSEQGRRLFNPRRGRVHDCFPAIRRFEYRDTYVLLIFEQCNTLGMEIYRTCLKNWGWGKEDRLAAQGKLVEGFLGTTSNQASAVESKS